MIETRTTADVARQLGVQTYRIGYAIQIGALPAPRIVAGRRLWTAEEARAARDYFDALGNRPNRGRPARQTRRAEPAIKQDSR